MMLKITTMKKSFSITLILALLFSTGIALGQKIKTGSLQALKGQSGINLQYDYSAMAVGKFDNEADYLKKGIADRNAKEPGTGEIWAEKWKAAKTGKYQPAFEEDFNKQANDCGLSGATNPSAGYTLVIHVTYVEQGVETIVMGTAKQASIDLTVDLVETTAPDKVLATVVLESVKPKSSPSVSVGGVSVDKKAYDATLRISECFESAGKQLGKFLCKQLK